MVRRISLAIIPLLGLLCQSGCVRYSDQKILPKDVATGEEKITAVITTQGDEITFDASAGTYELSYVLRGVSEKGDSISVNTSDVREIRSAHTQFYPTDQIRMQKIAEVLLKDGMLYQFDQAGGRISDVKVIGKKKNKTAVSLDLQDIAGGCISSPRSVDVRMLFYQKNLRPKEILLNTDRLLVLDSSGVTIGAATEVVRGFTKDGGLFSIPLDSILSVRVARFDPLKTFVATVGALAVTGLVVALVIAATKHSCPFIYSYDGNRYQFDAEPLGGATTAGLERSDYSRLEFLRPAGGTYRLLVRNEVEETQYINRLELLYVDHDSSKTPVVDNAGTIRLIGPTLPPVAVHDEAGNDLRAFFAARDGISWETRMSSAAKTVLENTRHTLTFRYVRPQQAKRATLVIHGGTTLWGSTMIRILYELRGKEVDRWYAEADRKGPALYEVMQYLDREELYGLKLYARRGEEWVQKGSVIGGGPLMYETQLVSFPLGGFTDDTLQVQVHPPLGFWSFDQISVTYDSSERVEFHAVPLLSAFDQDGQDVKSKIAEDDADYLELPTKLHETRVEFSTPPGVPGLQRSLFARTSGYYRIHLKKEGPEDLATIERLGKIPGEIVRLSVQKYGEWRLAMRQNAAHVAR